MNQFRTVICFILVSVSHNMIYAQSFVYERESVLALQRAATVTDLRKISQEFDELEIRQRACDQQLQENLLPWSCYMEMEHALYLKIKPRYSHVELDKLCFLLATRTTDKSISALQKLSTGCATQAAERVRINRYKAGMDIEL